MPPPILESRPLFVGEAARAGSVDDPSPPSPSLDFLGKSFRIVFVGLADLEWASEISSPVLLDNDVGAKRGNSVCKLGVPGS